MTITERLERHQAMAELLETVSFGDWRFVMNVDDTTRERYPYLQIEFVGRCSVSGQDQLWKSRKWRLSPHMTDSEIVQTAFKAVLTALEHEARESFKYKGRAVFGQHFDVDVLWEMAGDPQAQDVRPPCDSPAG